MFLLKKRYFIKKPYDVIFYYPQHFNRSENGENPYFEKLIKSCIKNNFSYLLLEEPVKNTNFPRSRKAKKFDFWFYVVIMLRKIIPALFFKNNVEKEQFIGKLISILTLNYLKANTYITISNSMINVLCGFNPKANVYDLQHGIIYSWHWGYFSKDGHINDFLKSEKINFLVYGSSYKEIFFKNQLNINFKNPEAIKVIGNVFAEKVNFKEIELKKVLYTLQITDDLTNEEIRSEKINLFKFLDSIAAFFVENNLGLILKNHPRFNDDSFLNSLLEQFSFISISKKNIEDLADEIFLHFTKSSTSLFELAEKGVPTLLIPNDLGSKIFIEEYKYPLGTIDLCSQIKEYINNSSKYKEDQLKVNTWHSKFYQPYNEEEFIKIITNNG